MAILIFCESMPRKDLIGVQKMCLYLPQSYQFKGGHQSKKNASLDQNMHDQAKRNRDDGNHGYVESGSSDSAAVHEKNSQCSQEADHCDNHQILPAQPFHGKEILIDFRIDKTQTREALGRSHLNTTRPSE